MKKTFLLAVIILSCFASPAQTIKYESSFEKARAIALQQQKPIVIIITVPMPLPSPGYMKGLNNESVVNKFNSHFINYKIEKDDTANSRKIIREYKIYRFPSIIFLDPKGGLLFSDVLLSRAQSLLEMADKALAAGKEKSLVDYDSTYKSGTPGRAFLKEYILRRRNAGITNNADLVEKYVTGLTVADLHNYEEVLFILKAGPLIDSTAYKLAHTNKYVVDSIYKTEPLKNRVAMNNAMSENTMASAVANKNRARAMAVANFSRNTWTQDRLEGQKKWYLRMLHYYNAVKDTANYLQQAAFYYDQYYMRMSVDSARKKDSLNYEAAKNKAKENAVVISNGTSTRRSFSFTYSKDAYATELNNAAWNFYKLAGDNNDHLLKAMLWSKRAVEYEPKPAFYDTYAHLLYKLKFFDEAERMEKNAIESAKAGNIPAATFEAAYKKIKNRTL